MNPYTERMLNLLGDRKPLEVLGRTPALLEDLFWELKEPGLDRSYEPGKWTARQIFAHLTDVELAIGFRVRQALTDDGHTIQPIDQDAWLGLHHGIDTSLAVETFRSARLWNLALYGALSTDQLQRRAHHPERGEETVELIVKLNAAHDLNHLAQLEAIARSGQS